MGGAAIVSEVISNQAGPSKQRNNPIVLILIGVLAVAALFYLFTNQQQDLRTSPTGLEGLRIWLVGEGHDVQSYDGGWPLDADTIGLLIVPLYDTALDAARSEPLTVEELLVQQDENDLSSASIRHRMEQATTLLVLPKWRTGMRLTGQAHPSMLVDPDRLTRSLNAVLPGDRARISQHTDAFHAFDYEAGSGAQLNALTYLAQTFSAPGCTPVVGTADAMILAECSTVEGKNRSIFMVLSDPDLINNHGLRLGDNAAIVDDILDVKLEVHRSAGQGQILIDYSERAWFATNRGAGERERSWADLQRFFSGPFTLIWVGLAIALLLTLWRAGIRFGPLNKIRDTMSASKMMAIAARARLMRLSNQDGALTHDYGKARLAATAAALFGPAHARHWANPETFVGYTRRRHPALADRLVAVLNTLESMPAGASAPQAMAAVHELESILEQITRSGAETS